MRPAGCPIGPNLALRAILVGDPWLTVSVCRDSTRNEQVERVKTGVCRINFDGSFANVTLFSARKILFLMQTSAKTCRVCALTFASFVHKIVPRYLLVMQVFLSFATLPNLCFAICERK